MHEERLRRVRRYLALITGQDEGVALESLADLPATLPSTESPLAEAAEASSPSAAKSSLDSPVGDAARSALDKFRRGEETVTPFELAATEAIIIPDLRPAVDIVAGEFSVAHPLWRKLNTDPVLHGRVAAAIPRVGRIELPGNRRIPYGGTGFIVGEGLVMTNRHVAEIFATGQGQQIEFRAGQRAGIDLKQERDQPAGTVLAVTKVRMIHPYWDMALLEVSGLPPGIGSLQLSTEDARDLVGREIAVIGYPAYDPLRNDPAVQDELFDKTYGVKRLQPGQLKPPRGTGSFGKVVTAAAHDCSTLGGNSGSALVDLGTGQVLALHFGGKYLDTNYAVPASELARDPHVRDAGVLFGGSVSGGPTPDWLSYWTEMEVAPPEASPRAGSAVSAAVSRAVSVQRQAGRVSIEVPLRITVELGDPAERETDLTERAVEPAHDPDYANRAGYDPGFLGDTPAPIPTPSDPAALARTKNGETELKYQNFSILMHAQRRLALVCASNVSKEAALRRPEPGTNPTRKALGGLGEHDTEKWFPDPRLDARFQLPDIFYTRDRGAFDKGHLVRRDDVAWGRTSAELQRANGDTFHVTNCSPQVAQFNRSTLGEDNWGDLENLVLAEASKERLCLFAGPILSDADQVFTGRGDDRTTLRARIPSRFWKVVVAPIQDGIAAFGFILEQDLTDVELEFTVSEEFRRLQVPLAAIEAATGLQFSSAIRDGDTFYTDDGMEIARRGGLEREG